MFSVAGRFWASSCAGRLFDCAVPLLVVNGLNPEQGKKFVRASSNMLVSSEPNDITATYAEPSGASFNAQAAFLASDISQIREIALRMVRPDSAAAEKRCWQMAAAWLGLSVADDEIRTPYREEYSGNGTNILDKAFVLELARLNMISKATALEQLRRIGTLPEGFDAEDEAVRVAREIGANAGNGFGGSLMDRLQA